jgi:3'-5' exoribonuclease
LKKQFIENLHPGDYVDDVFYIVDRETRKTREGKDFLIFQLRDRTGMLKAILFEPTTASGITKGSFVHVTGKLNEYNDRINIKVDDMWEKKDEEVDFRDFLPATTRDVDDCYKRLKNAAHAAPEPLTALLTAFFDNSTFERQFKLAPAGVRAHHAYLGGCVFTPTICL